MRMICIFILCCLCFVCIERWCWVALNITRWFYLLVLSISGNWDCTMHMVVFGCLWIFTFKAMLGYMYMHSHFRVGPLSYCRYRYETLHLLIWKRSVNSREIWYKCRKILYHWLHVIFYMEFMNFWTCELRDFSFSYIRSFKESCTSLDISC